MSNITYATAAMGEYLYVGGEFTTISGLNIPYIAKWDGTTWVEVGAGLDGPVRTLVSDGTYLYAGGDFTGKVAKWDGTAWSSVASQTELSCLTIDNPSPNLNDYFGMSVSLSADGTKVAIGCPYNDPSGVTNAGTVYICNAVTGALIATIDNPSPGANDQFGVSVSLSADGARVAIGCYNNTVNGATQAGSVYIHDAATGALITTINNPFPNLGDYFGGSVSLSADGTKVAIGCDGNDPSGVTNAGSVYICNAVTGALITTIDNPSPNTGDYFGGSVSLSADGTKVAIGCDGNDPSGVTDAGTVYICNAVTGALIATIDNPSPGAYDQFCCVSLSADGTKVAIGCYNNTVNGATQAGSVYIYEPTPLNNSVYSLALDSSNNLYAGGDFTACGSTSLARIAKHDGITWSALGSGCSNTVRALATDGTYLYAGGDFQRAGLKEVGKVARWTIGGSTDTAWSALGYGFNPDSSVRALAFDSSGYLCAGGILQTSNKIAMYNVARFNGATVWSALGSGLDNTVHSLFLDSSGVFWAGGDFTGYLSRWNGSAWLSHSSPVPYAVHAVFEYDYHLSVAGVFSSAILQFVPSGRKLSVYKGPTGPNNGPTGPTGAAGAGPLPHTHGFDGAVLLSNGSTGYWGIADSSSFDAECLTADSLFPALDPAVFRQIPGENNAIDLKPDTITMAIVPLASIQVAEDNAGALALNLLPGQIYRTSTGEVKVVY